MIDFLKGMLGINQSSKSRPTQLKSAHHPHLLLGGGIDTNQLNSTWQKAWSEALRDERLSAVDVKTLDFIEQHIKKGISEGRSSQKIATELRPAFESVGLKRKDALNLAAKATNLVYQFSQSQISIGAKFVMKHGSVEDALGFLKKAHEEYPKKKG